MKATRKNFRRDRKRDKKLRKARDEKVLQFCLKHGLI